MSDDVAVLCQFDGLSVGFPGLLATAENSKSMSAVSVTGRGVDHDDSCGDWPSLVKILVDIQSCAVPDGTPSDQPVVVGVGDAKDPPVGAVTEDAFTRRNANALKEDWPLDPSCPS